MAKKKPETKVEEVQEEVVEVSPEQLVELQGGTMQTVMSIGLAERVQIEDRHDRILYLDDEVDDRILRTLILQIAKINGEDFGKPVKERIPIKLIVNSGGGNAIIGMSLVNVIQNSITPVIGICLGLCASMAFAIYAVCHTRLAVPDAVFMVHDGYETCLVTTTTKARDWDKFSPRLDERYNRAIASRTKFTVKELTEMSPHDNWFFADELVEMNMVDGIVGKDISIEDIFAFMSDDICYEECDCEDCSDE